jgi:tagaturonate reductase
MSNDVQKGRVEPMGAQLLNRKFLQDHKSQLQGAVVGSLEDLPERVIQFGEGNFLRAFVDWHFHELSKKGLFRGKVVVVQPIENGMVKQLGEQDNVYTLLRRGLQDNAPVEKTDIITIINRGINPYTQWKEFLQCAWNPDLRFMVSNTTEAGIAYIPLPKPRGECPKTFPAKVTMFLYERFRTFQGSPDRGMIIIPCELIKQNGMFLKHAIQHHAIDWNLGAEFNMWLEKHNFFCDTLVDRIVPGFPKEEIDVLTKKYGYRDNMLVTSELFHLWVIHGDERVRKELQFTEAGLNVVWDDVRPYRTLKVRILNGLHTMFSISSFMAGNNTVLESLNDDVLGKFIAKGLNEEILPSLDVAMEEKMAFAKTVLERFRNPFIKHLVSSINLNSLSKYRVRVLPSLLKYYEKNNTIPPVLSFSLAALISYFEGKREAGNGMTGMRNGVPFPILDDAHVLEFFAQRHALYTNDVPRLCRETLANTSFWDRDLNTIPGLTELITVYVQSIQHDGMRSALQKAIA